MKIETHERLHILASPICNNNCIFCIEEDRDGRFNTISAITKEEIKKLLEINKFRNDVIFTSGEPTINENLPLYIKWAKDLSYRTIGICTNGRRFSYKDYAEKLLKQGLNHVIVAIHGGDAKTHDSLTRTKGSFQQTMNGIKNLAELKAKNSLKILTSSVINKRNYKKMRAIYDALYMYVDEMIFNVIQPWGRGWTYFRQLVPRYTDVGLMFSKCISDAGVKKSIFIQDIPYCTTEKLPDFNRGFVERHVHYDHRTKDKEPWNEEEGFKGSRVQGFNEEELRGLAEKKQVEAYNIEKHEIDLTGHSRDDQDIHTKVKRPDCKLCIYDYICDGVWRNYIKMYGWDEFIPIKRGNNNERSS